MNKTDGEKRAEIINNPVEERILILAPTGRDAAMTVGFFKKADLAAEACADAQELCRKISEGAGLVFLTGEALDFESLNCLIETLSGQPAWSDVPLIVLTSGGGENPANVEALASLGEAGNVTLIERPVRLMTLLSAVKSALRARRRQYDVRENLIAQIKAQEALRESEEKYRLLVEGAKDYAIFIIDLDGMVKSWNLGATRIFGYEEAEIVGQNGALLFTPEDLAAGADKLEIRKAIAEGRAENERWHVRRDNTRFYASGLMLPLCDENGNLQALYKIMRDETGRKVHENERERLLQREQVLRAEAEDANRLKDEFLATVSHELRTPLNAILGWSQMMQNGSFNSDSAARGMEVIFRNARSQAQLIDDLLDVSRIITGKMNLNPRPISLGSVIDSAVETMRPAIDAKTIDLQISLSETPSVIGDSDRLQQVVWNLISNAVKFTPENGQIRVRLETIDSQARIVVSDTGKGIGSNFLPHVFERFRQADGTTTRKYGGLGLGLAIVRHIVDLHGGTVEASSPGDGKGTTFIVKLPILGDTIFHHAENQVQAGKENGKIIPADESYHKECDQEIENLRILLVDDEIDTLEMLQEALVQCNTMVRFCTTAADALEMTKKWRPDVLVSDIAMPDAD